MDNDDKNRFENDLIHQRLTWLGTFEGLLFVANHYGDHPYVLALVGLAIALSVDLAIREANDRLADQGGQVKGWLRYFMPGTIIPKAIALAWVVLLFEKLFPCVLTSFQRH